MRKILFFLLIAFVFLFIFSDLRAATLYDVECTNEECNYKTKVSIGGGYGYWKVMGYCGNCRKMVSITKKVEAQDVDISAKELAKRELEKEILFELWDPAVGHNRKAYKCPDCGEPFFAVENIDEFRYCPECGKPTLRYEIDIFYD